MINEAYQKIIDPKSLRLHFKTKEEFESWLKTGSLQDLKCTLQVFENEEMYEDCILIKNKIDEHK